MRDRFFTDGPGPFADRLRAEGVDLMVGAHYDLLGSSLGDLVQAGFRPAQVTVDALQSSFTDHLNRLADEAAAWITGSGDSHGDVEECAADVICALAVLYELRLTGAYKPEELGDAAARLVMAAQAVGVQETMLIFARLGHIETVAKAQIAHEAAQEAGRERGNKRRAEAEEWKRRARVDWGDYAGKFSKSAWARRFAAKYERGWRVVFEAISKPDDK